MWWFPYRTLAALKAEGLVATGPLLWPHRPYPGGVVLYSSSHGSRVIEHGDCVLYRAVP